MNSESSKNTSLQLSGMKLVKKNKRGDFSTKNESPHKGLKSQLHEDLESVGKESQAQLKKRKSSREEQVPSEEAMAKGKPTTSKETKSCGYPHAHIPHEVILQILQNLPVKTLMKFTCVSKLWFGSIENDQRFQEAHFVRSQKNTILMFKFLSYDNDTDFGPCHHLFYLPIHDFGIAKREKVFPQLHKLAVFGNRYRKTLIGSCNGLVCFQVGDPSTIIVEGNWSYIVIDIFNFSKLQKIRIVSRIHNPRKFCIQNFRFGYDYLSNKYKLMCIVTPPHYCDYSDYDKPSYTYLILELGCSETQLWREIKIHDTTQLGYSRQPSHCINGVLYWWKPEINGSGRDLVSFDLHEEKFQVINLPKNLSCYSVHKYHQLEYRKCLCLAIIEKSNTYRIEGAVELYILEDRIKQVWVEETITYHLPVITGILPTDIQIKIIELAGRIYLYWGKLLVHEGIRSNITQFYDLRSREVTDVRFGCEIYANYDVTNHVENLICLKSWATREGDGGEELGRIDKNTLKIMQDMFKQMRPTLNAAVSFFSSSRGITMI